MRKLSYAIASFCVIAIFTAPAWSHHNMSALFDFNERFTETGSLKELDWRNPHIYMFVDVANEAGELETWKNSLDKTVTVEASRARDGSKSGLIRQVTLADGSVVSACPQNC
jgi:hypothetical protein